jgi:hypothetical protein
MNMRTWNRTMLWIEDGAAHNRVVALGIGCGKGCEKTEWGYQ